MKKQLIFQALFLFILSAGIPVIHAQCYEMIWADEFNYEGLPDPDKWNYDGGGDGWGNNELQFYTKSRKKNARVEKGKLIIEARKEYYRRNDYTSARLVSRNKGDWKYGRVEVRAKLPGGTGVWPAIWMLPTNWEYGGWPNSGEIDIMEYVGYDPGVVHGTVHTEDFNHQLGTQVGNSIKVPDAESKFHNYAIEWSQSKIDFFVDNDKYFTFNKLKEDPGQWPFDKAFHLLLNIAVGGNWGGAEGVDPDIFPQQMEVDYVRVYKQISGLVIKQNKSITPNAKDIIFSVAPFSEYHYQWIMPDDVEILSKTDSSAIHVNWGSKEDIIQLVIEGDCGADTLIKKIRFEEEGDGDDLTDVRDRHQMNDGIHVFPNPVSDNSPLLKIISRKKNKSLVHAMLFSSDGRLLKNRSFHLKIHNQKTLFNLKSLTRGIYWIKFQSEHQNAIEKIILH